MDSGNTGKPMHLNDLYRFINDYYNLDEIRSLCFELGINYENLGGDTRNRKARGLIIQVGLREEDNCQHQYVLLLQKLESERAVFYSELFAHLDTEQAQGEAKEVALARRYCAELDVFIKATQPLHEKALSRFGLEQRVGTVTIVFILFVFGLLAFLLWQQIRPDQMRGDFNIAVAPFQVIGAEAEIGEDVANSIYGRLAGNFEGGGSPIVSVWGPGEPVLNPVPVVAGSTDGERDTRAAQLADKINADIVVYGVVEREGTEWNVIPKFYVSPNNFENASEILGPYDLGEAFGLAEGSRRALRITAGDELTPRSEFLTQVAIGLTYYSIASYERATETFLGILSTMEVSATDEETLRFVYLMLGNTSLKIALQEFEAFTPGAVETNMTVMEKMNTHLEAAEMYFTQSAAVDPDYARAYLGLGDIAYLQSVVCADTGCKIIAEPLLESISFYEDALLAPNAPVAAVPVAKANFGLGQVYFRQSLIRGDVEFTNAIDYFTAVITEYEAGNSPRARDIAAESHARLGLIACQQGNLAATLQAYQAAIDLYEDDTLSSADHIFTKDVRNQRIDLYENRIAQLTSDETPGCTGN